MIFFMEKRYAYKDKRTDSSERTKMRMGIYDVSLDSMDLISDIDFTYRLKGTKLHTIQSG